MKMFPKLRVGKSDASNTLSPGGLSSLTTLRNKRLIVTCVVLLFILIAGSAYFMLNIHSSKSNKPSITTKQYEIGRAVSEPEPADAADKVRFYANIADTYASYGEYQKAVEAMLKADSFIKDRTVDNGQSLNLGIAQLYKTLGENDKAKVYYQREIDRIKDAPDNVEALNSLKKMKDAL